MRISDWSSDVCSSDLLPSLARARSITQEPTAAELNGASLSLRRRGGDIERLVNGPRAREEAGMRLACIDHRFELSIGKDTERGQVRWEMRPIRRFGRRDRCHCRRLDQRRGMRARTLDAQ